MGLLVLSLSVSACVAGGEPESSGSGQDDSGAAASEVEEEPTAPEVGGGGEGDVSRADGAWRDLAQEDGSFHPYDFVEALAACVREQGFPAEAVPEDMGVRYETVPESQRDAARAARESCDQQVQIDPRWDEPWEGEQLERAYEWYLSQTIPCLEDLGITAHWDVPSFETFEARWPTPDQWNPYLQIAADDETLTGQRECPGIPFDELYD